MAIKRNVVKSIWEVRTKQAWPDGTVAEKRYLVEAESEEAARLRVPEEETVISVSLAGGKGKVKEP